MRRIVVVSCLVLVALSASGQSDRPTVEITAPATGASVPERPTIQGKVSNPDATVWVAVHPMGVSGYWIQPPVTVGSDGSWSVQIYVGRPGDLDAGSKFEVRAVAMPYAELHEGEVLPNWPKGSAVSNVIEVTRQ